MHAEQKFLIMNCLAEPAKREGGELLVDFLQHLLHMLHILALSYILTCFAPSWTCVNLILRRD